MLGFVHSLDLSGSSQTNQSAFIEYTSMYTLLATTQASAQGSTEEKNVKMKLIHDIYELFGFTRDRGVLETILDVLSLVVPVVIFIEKAIATTIRIHYTSRATHAHTIIHHPHRF